MKRNVFIFVFLLVVTGNILMFAQTVHNAVQAELILKIIKLDRNFKRLPDPIKIGITSDDMLKAMKKYSRKTIRGKNILVEELSTLEDIPNYNIVYIDRNWRNNYEAACRKATQNKVLMFCNSYQAVESDRGGIAFRTLQGKPKIVINLDLVRKQGTNFPSDLLKLTLVVGTLKR